MSQHIVKVRELGSIKIYMDECSGNLLIVDMETCKQQSFKCIEEANKYALYLHLSKIDDANRLFCGG